MQLMNSKQRKVHFISLGCARNKVDSEVMLGTMLGAGWMHIDEPEDADAIVINTCGFIAAAKEESIDTILGAAEHKIANPDLRIVVAGCLTQRYKRQLVQGLPEVDLFVGTDEFAHIAEFMEKPLPSGTVKADRTHYLYNESLPRVNSLGGGSAYVKVAEGCDHNCAFCMIPAIRGRLRSRPLESILAEVRALVEQGVVEVNLIAQDLAAYGREIADAPKLLELLKGICGIEGLRWVRPLYMYPEYIDDAFLAFFASEAKLVKYLDIPIQHASDRILKNMNRDVTRLQIEEVIERLRQNVPGIAIRTSLMVGFPGETEADVDELVDFVQTVKFDHLGCFQYSQEEGTVAGRMADQVPAEVKQQRYDRVMHAQQKVSREIQLSKLGMEVPVLLKGPSSDGDAWEGRLDSQAPEVDGMIYVTGDGAVPGSIQMVRITEAYDYDLVGELLK